MIGLHDAAFVAALTPAAVALSPVAGMALWLKASSLALADNAPVVTWPDLSGNGFDAAQPNVTSRPVFKPGILNGKSAVRFDALGVSDGVSDDVFGTHGTYSAYTIFAVAKVDGSFSPQRFYANDSNNRLLGVYFGNWEAYTGSFLDSGIAASSAAVMLSLVASGAGRVLAVNGVVAITDSTPAGSLGTNYRIGSSNSSGEFTQGDIAEIIVYPTALSDSDRETVEAYLAAEYAL